MAHVSVWYSTHRVDFTKPIHCIQSCRGTLMIAHIYPLYFIIELLINPPERGETCKGRARARSRVFSRNAARLLGWKLPVCPYKGRAVLLFLGSWKMGSQLWINIPFFQSAITHSDSLSNPRAPLLPLLPAAYLHSLF